MSNIPEARRILKELKDNPDIGSPAVKQSLENALKLMTRTAPKRRGPIKNRVTPEKVAEVRRLYRTYPNIHFSEIAAKVELNHGRVSEIINKIEKVSK